MPILVQNRDDRPVTQPQVARLFAILLSAGLDRSDLDEVLAQMGFPEHPDELTRAQYEDVVATVEALGGAA